MQNIDLDSSQRQWAQTETEEISFKLYFFSFFPCAILCYVFLELHPFPLSSGNSPHHMLRSVLDNHLQRLLMGKM